MADAAIEQIKQRLDIVELLQEYLRLTKAGGNWRALCPFHNEKTPSFMISQDKQIWHCFGCAKGGDIFTFVQEIEGVEFSEALRILAQRAGVTLTAYDRSHQDYKAKLLDIVTAAQKFYQQALQQSAAGQIARDYVAQRGLRADWQEQFGLGYSYDEWSRLLHHLQSLSYRSEDIMAAGLIAQHTDGAGYYDRFRSRLMFPLYDVNGTAVGFTARTLKPDEPGGKYINSPQSLIYDKSKVVYGLQRAKQAIKKFDAAIIVEGNIDVITAHQAGFPNVVATSGTAFTAEQITLLKRYSNNVLLAFDMDQAGLQAAQRGIDLALHHDMNIKVIQLPASYKDPDECIKADPTAFKDAIRQAKHIIDFWFEQVTQPLQLSRVEHKKKAVQQLIPVLAKIHDTVEQAHYVQRLAEMVQVEPSLIRAKLMPAKTSSSRPRSVGITTPPAPAQDRSSTLSRQVVALLVRLPEQFKYCLDYLDPAFVTESGSCELYKKMIDYYNNTAQFDTTAFTTTHPEERAAVETIQLLVYYTYPDLDQQQLQAELISGIKELHKMYIQRRLHELEYTIKLAEQQHDSNTAKQVLQASHLLTQQLTELSK